MDFFDKRLARKRASTRLRVQKYRALQKRSRNENSSTENCVNNSIMPSSSIQPEANISNFENWELFEINNYQEQNIQPPIDVQDNLYLQNETDSSDANATREVNTLDVSENEPTDIASISSDSSIDSREQVLNNTVNDLREWAFQFPPLPHSRLDNLLNILRPIIPQLPKSSKTFLQTTCESYEIEKLDEHDDGLFVYFGLTSQLIKYLNPDLHSNTIQLIINVDGLPLFKSSSMSFWPILCKIFHQPDIYKPFPIAIYCGTKKPGNVEKYFEKFIEEINLLQAEGLNVKDRFQISIKAFICDRPARSFVKCIKNHNGFWACERCFVRGKRYKNRIIYPNDNYELRTDRSFREQINSEHHKGISPLINIKPPIDMINSFPLDAMHLVYLGVMKKLLECWLEGTEDRRYIKKLSYNSKAQLSFLLTKIQRYIPEEFQRTTRSLSEFKKFKATEFQFLLLYIGPIIFKKILPEDIYKHFMLLHTAIRILSGKDTALKYYTHAKNLLKKFVYLVSNFYGDEFLISNVHNLLHIADDVLFMQCPLSDITSFSFENALGKMKKLLRNGNKPLSQICRRYNEICNVHKIQPKISSEIVILKKSNCEQSGKINIKRLRYKEVLITTKSPNHTVLLSNGKIIQINNIYLPENRSQLKYITICGDVLVKKKSMYNYPCDSKYLLAWKVTKRNGQIITCKVNEIKKKMITINLSEHEKEKIYTLGLLHM